MPDTVIPHNRSALTRYIIKAHGMNLTARQALRMYREAGGSIRTQDFNRLWQIVADSPSVYGMSGVRRNG